MSSNNHAEGVPVRLDGAPDHREAGVPVSIPEDASAVESTSGHKANTPKEKH